MKDWNPSSARPWPTGIASTSAGTSTCIASAGISAWARSFFLPSHRERSGWRRGWRSVQGGQWSKLWNHTRRKDLPMGQNQKALALAMALTLVSSCCAFGQTIPVERFPKNPIIHSGLSKKIGINIQGPSLIKIPSWIKNPLEKFYL